VLECGKSRWLQILSSSASKHFLTGARQCDFVVWCPQEFVIFSVQYDESWADNADYLVEFYAKYMLPVLTKGHIPD
jgi:hypothetical protein